MSEQELLMKIANGEIKDKTKVKFDDGIIYEFWEEDEELHGFLVDERRFGNSPIRLFRLGNLSNKVEVLEEDKEIEEIPFNNGMKEFIDVYHELEHYNYKINEIRIAVNELKKGK